MRTPHCMCVGAMRGQQWLLRHGCRNKSYWGAVFFSQLSKPQQPLQPQVVAVKSRIEALLGTYRAGDHVIYNSNSESGITDLSFENRETEEKGKAKTVSVYFKMDADGIKAYRQAAKAYSENPNVELSYTPHFGQSRITFKWEHFWTTVNTEKLGSMMHPHSLLKLSGGKEEIEKMS
jgi:hypothetical protein